MMALDNQNIANLVASVHTPNVVNGITRNNDQKDQETVLPALNSSSIITNVSNYPSDNNFAYNYNNEVFDLQAYFASFPPGYRFCPLDGELIVYYLSKKISQQPLPLNQIVEANIYLHTPNELSVMYPSIGKNQWYFFTPREKKYANGSRPNRAAGDGYWKATGKDKQVIGLNGTGVIGYRKALVYYRGKPRDGKKTNWMMHEYRVNNPPPRARRSANDMRLDDYVLCKIYYNKNKQLVAQGGNEDANDQAEEDAEPSADDTLDEPQQLINSNVAPQTIQNGAIPDNCGLNHQINGVGAWDSEPKDNICDGVRTLANWMECDYDDYSTSLHLLLDFDNPSLYCLSPK